MSYTTLRGCGRLVAVLDHDEAGLPAGEIYQLDDGRRFLVTAEYLAVGGEFEDESVCLSAPTATPVWAEPTRVD